VPVETTNEGLRLAQTLVPALILLDATLPAPSQRSPNGIELCGQLRAVRSTRHIPTILISDRSDESDQLVGFASAADGYVVRPYSSRLLAHRIDAILRRSRQSSLSTVLQQGSLRVDLIRHKAWRNEQLLDLRPTEFRLLGHLMRHPGRVFTRPALIEAIIGAAVITDRGIDVHVKNLRQRIGRDAIETVRDVGYRLNQSPASENPRRQQLDGLDIPAGLAIHS
jgi:two-component system phosphate regulon response regulator PhoB